MGTKAIATVRRILTDGVVTTIVVKWAGMANTDVGEPFYGPGWADRNMQAIGTFGAGGSVAIEGASTGGPDAAAQQGAPTTAPAGTDWGAVTEGGVAIAATTSQIHQLDQAPIATRPHVTAGDGTTALDVYLTLRKPA